jgi:hypothetical protein
MDDITVSGMPCVRKPAVIVRHETTGKATEHADDEMLVRLLITSWTLATGRTLPAGVPPHLLSEDELISFWADDQVAAGRPASPAAVAS